MTLVPLDHSQNKTRSPAVLAARLFSNIVSPPVMFALLGFATAFQAYPILAQGLRWGVLYGVLVSLIPIIFVFYLLKTGRISDLHMSKTSERHIPYAVGASCAFLAYLILTLLAAARDLRCLALFNGIELTTLGLINSYWLISMHATGITATTLLTALLFGPLPALALIPLMLIVNWIRLYLKRHTLAQLVAGTFLGVATVWLLTLVGCF